MLRRCATARNGSDSLLPLTPTLSSLKNGEWGFAAALFLLLAHFDGVCFLFVDG
jgi:hypothetical protein